MHRFVKKLREKLDLSSRQKELFCFVFSLMLNSKTLSTISEISRSLAFVCLTSNISKKCIDHLKFLNESIKTRRENGEIDEHLSQYETYKLTKSFIKDTTIENS
jgi:hypothetical protein